MNKLSYVCVLSGILGAVSTAQASSTDDMVNALFAGTQGIPHDMQQNIAQQIEKKGFIVQQGKVATSKCGVIPVTNEVKDLNGDGKPEVFMLIGNECTSGTIGSTLYLFTQEADGSVRRHFGFSAAGYELIPAKSGDHAWPAVLVKGTGACQPIWGYSNGRYGFDHLYESKKGACYVPQSDNVGG